MEDTGSKNENDSLIIEAKKEITGRIEQDSILTDAETKTEENSVEGTIEKDRLDIEDTENKNGNDSLIIKEQSEITEKIEHDSIITDPQTKEGEKSKDCAVKKEVDVELPSAVTDREEIYIPHNITNDDPSIYGKWLIFTNGDLKLQDHLWIQLQNLLKNGTLILLASSTAKKCDDRGPFQGVIKCYTSKDLNVIRQSGIAIQSILNDDTILDYKTNKASQDNLYQGRGNRLISKFMLTVNGKLYQRDKLYRWKEITDAEYHNYTFEENYLYQDINVDPVNKRYKLDSESIVLPSQETRKKRKTYDYPSFVHYINFSGMWCLICSIIDTNDKGLIELDHAWKEAKALCDEGVLKSIRCETKAYKPPQKKLLYRRTIYCEVYDFVDITQPADKIREKMSYNIPMYFKVCCYNEKRKPELRLKYFYTDDKELYEFVETKWKLVKSA